jgi:hypothetical protein
VIVVFQAVLILSGNLSFLNWLTIVPALACFDDSLWARILPGRLGGASETARRRRPAEPADGRGRLGARRGRRLPERRAGGQPVLDPNQVMNASFDPLELVNTYGAFGTIGRERTNVVFEGTDSAVPDETAPSGSPTRTAACRSTPRSRPPQIAPYQLRLDWQMWFAAMASPAEYPWTLHLVWKLLHNDPGAVGLFASNPSRGGPPLRAGREYRYAFADPASHRGGAWWTRERLGIWIPAFSTDSDRLRRILVAYGWIRPPALPAGR